MRLFRGKEGKFTIRKATEKDMDFCVEIISKTMGDQPTNKEVIEQALRAPNVILLVAKSKDNIVGIISGVAFPSMVPPPRIDFFSVSDEESARKGLHSQLIDEFIEELKERLPNVQYVETTVPTINPQFVAIFSMKGFIIIGFIRSEPPLSDVIVLRKYFDRATPTPYTI